MFKPALVALAAGLALSGMALSASEAEAQAWHSPRGWSAPQGHFVVYAQACAPLRGYRENRGRYHSRWSRQRNFTLRCAPGAFSYVPTWAERRMGITHHRIQAHEARWDPRRQQFFAHTRWGRVPVHVVYGPTHPVWR
jgi:hypothetical protein